MALCPTCYADVPPGAPACPRCGGRPAMPLFTGMRTSTWVGLGVMGLLIAAWAFASFVYPGPAALHWNYYHR